MVSRMKTTIELADNLAIKAKKLARRRGTTLRALIEDGLRRELKVRSDKNDFLLRNESVKGNGLQPEFEGQGWAKIKEEIYKGRGS